MADEGFGRAGSWLENERARHRHDARRKEIPDTFHQGEIAALEGSLSRDFLSLEGRINTRLRLDYLRQLLPPHIRARTSATAIILDRDVGSVQHEDRAREPEVALA